MTGAENNTARSRQGFEKHLKKAAILGVAGAAALSIAFLITTRSMRTVDSPEFTRWLEVGAGKDWSAEAAQGEPQAQFHLGVSMIRSNLIIMVDQIPRLSSLPFIGKRLFRKVSYGIDSNIDPAQWAEAYQWIKKSADQGFAPAKAAKKWFEEQQKPDGATNATRLRQSE